jgi:hypothetical protein
MSWTRNSSSVRIIAFQKPTFDTATLMSASIGRVPVTRELLGTKNKITNQLIVLMSLGVSERDPSLIFDIHSWTGLLWFISRNLKNPDIPEL